MTIITNTVLRIWQLLRDLVLKILITRKQYWNCVVMGVSSVQFSHSVVSNSLRPHGLQHARPPCPSPTPGIYSNSCVHWVGDAIQPSHPLSSPFPLALNLSQHQDRFQWVSSSHQVAKVLEFQLQHQSFQWIFRTDFLTYTHYIIMLHPETNVFFFIFLKKNFIYLFGYAVSSLLCGLLCSCEEQGLLSSLGARACLASKHRL